MERRIFSKEVSSIYHIPSKKEQTFKQSLISQGNIKFLKGEIRYGNI